MHYFTHNIVVVFTEIFCSLSLSCSFCSYITFLEGLPISKIQNSVDVHTQFSLLPKHTGWYLKALCSCVLLQTTWKKLQLCNKILNQVKFLSSVNTHHLILCTDRVVKLLKLSGVLSSRLSIKMQFFRLQYQLIKITITAVFALLSRYKTVNWGLYGIYNIYVP